MNLPAVNLAVVQPPGYVHSLGFLDPVRYVRHQFRRLGATVTITKNRVREDSVNLVFGAHLGMPGDWPRRAPCVIVNLEQLGHGGAAVSDAYLALLSRCAVLDYDASNVAAYAKDPDDVPLLPFLHAPYLDDGTAPPIESRPIDLLFFGSMNARRQAWIARIEACGVQVSTFDGPLYGAERDAYVRQAKAVLNCHFYETSRFEQARAFQCLSLGTPVISERGPSTRAHPAYDDAVFWLGPDDVERFFRETFASPAFAAQARGRLEAFRRHDPIEAYADALAFASGYAQAVDRLRGDARWRPERLDIGPGGVPREGWLRVGAAADDGAEATLDLARPVDWDAPVATQGGGAVEVAPGSIAMVHARAVPEVGGGLDAWMDNLMRVLREDGELVVDAPLRPAPSDGPGARAGDGPDGRAWAPYVERFWTQGWIDHRFEWLGGRWVDASGRPCEPGQAAFARVALRKLATSPAERMLARTMRADFGGVPEDVADAVPGRAALPASDTVSAAPRAAAADTRPAAPPAPQTAMPRFLERLAHAR